MRIFRFHFSFLFWFILMFLYLVRHAWAEDRGDPRWSTDDVRPLTNDGSKRFAKMAKRLNAADMAPSLLLTSPLVRCVQTAQILADNLKSRPEMKQMDALAPNSDLAQILEQSNTNGQDVAWVGHEPDMGEMCAQLMGWPEGWVRFAKGSVAALRFPVAPPQAGQGVLYWMATAKLLDC